MLSCQPQRCCIAPLIITPHSASFIEDCPRRGIHRSRPKSRCNSMLYKLHVTRHIARPIFDLVYCPSRLYSTPSRVIAVARLNKSTQSRVSTTPPPPKYVPAWPSRGLPGQELNIAAYNYHCQPNNSRFSNFSTELKISSSNIGT